MQTAVAIFIVLACAAWLGWRLRRRTLGGTGGCRAAALSCCACRGRGGADGRERDHVFRG